MEAKFLTEEKNASLFISLKPEVHKFDTLTKLQERL
jgi:hypothetical protein